MQVQHYSMFPFYDPEEKISSVCELDVYPGDDQLLIIATELDQNPGPNILSSAYGLVQEISQRFMLPYLPTQVVMIAAFTQKSYEVPMQPSRYYKLLPVWRKTWFHRPIFSLESVNFRTITVEEYDYLRSQGQSCNCMICDPKSLDLVLDRIFTSKKEQ